MQIASPVCSHILLVQASPILVYIVGRRTEGKLICRYDEALASDRKLKPSRIYAAVALLRLLVAVFSMKDPSRKYVPLSDRGIAGFERYRAERELLAPGKGRMAVV